VASKCILKKEAERPPSKPYQLTAASVEHFGIELSVMVLAYDFQKGHVPCNRKRPSVPNTRLIFFAPIKSDSGNFLKSCWCEVIVHQKQNLPLTPATG